MITKNEIKFVRSLKIKKNRIKSDQFIVEGEKIVDELIDSSLELVKVYSTSSKYEPLGNLYTKILKTSLLQISNLKTPNKVVGIFRIPKPNKIDFTSQIVALDNISDPGNLGTIIRLCDWFGIEDLICSFDTVDCYNPKVIQASMGSISRVNITYLDLQKTLENNSLKTYGTYMQGDSIFEIDEIKNGVILFGNEANGINLNLSKLIYKKLSIPRFGKLKKTESLNVANALSIVLSENARKSIEK